MKSIQSQIKKYIFLVLILQYLLFFLSIIIARFYQIYNTQKTELTHISKQLKEIIVNNHGTYRSNHNADDMFAEINEKLSFVFQKEKIHIAYQVNLDNKRIYSYVPYKDTIEFIPQVQETKENQYFYAKPTSVSMWAYYYYLHEEPFDIWVYSNHQFVIINFTLIWGAIFLPFVLIISFLISKSISKKITTPIESISKASESIVSGKLETRISEEFEEVELDRLIKTLNATFNELEKSFNKISQFSADAAHEINTPLTIMRGQIEVCLKKERNTEEYQNALHHCLEEISNLSNIVDILLLTSRPNSYLAHDFKSINLSNILKELSSQFQILAEDKKITLTSSIENNILIKGNQTFFNQVCFNLFSNALKFTPINKKIFITLKSEDQHAILTFQDQGIGIKEDEIKKIFQRFYQINKSSNIGAGLGLSLVKWIVEQHHGSITCESKPEIGTTFTIKIRLISQ